MSGYKVQCELMDSCNHPLFSIKCMHEKPWTPVVHYNAVEWLGVNQFIYELNSFLSVILKISNYMFELIYQCTDNAITCWIQRLPRIWKGKFMHTKLRKYISTNHMISEFIAIFSSIFQIIDCFCDLKPSLYV